MPMGRIRTGRRKAQIRFRHSSAVPASAGAEPELRKQRDGTRSGAALDGIPSWYAVTGSYSLRSGERLVSWKLY
jgi:hypothetical protein